MQNTNKNGLQKAYEISLAIMRVSEVVRLESLKNALQEVSVQLLSSWMKKKREQTDLLDIMAGLIQLSHESRMIHSDNARTIMQMISHYQTSMKEYDNSTDVSKSESHVPVSTPASINLTNTIPVQPQMEKQTQEENSSARVIQQMSLLEKGSSAIKVVEEDENEPSDDLYSGGYGSDKRQAAIAEKIKELGNCRLKDLMEYMPDVSERTIRYDLQKLIESKVIERVGGGGPFSFYRARTGDFAG